ncbi:hypothetical protein VNO80_19180 [Phaseolus coccineus]|uniref:Uncharacterized protein n=1 Tax=Phaseolus coccineus TaxID=3886 RepID=A0AAN9MFN9_PHACN
MQNTMVLPPILVDNVSLSSPMIRVFDKKKKDTPIVDGSIVAKKPRGRPPSQKNKVQGIKTLLSSPNNKVDFGSNSATTQLVGNCALRESHILTNSFQCSDVSPLTEISTIRVMVELVKQMVYKEVNHGISPIEAHSDQTNKENTNETSKRDTNKTSTRTLDKSFPNEIPTSESDKDIADWTHQEFSNKGFDEWSKVDFSNFEVDD